MRLILPVFIFLLVACKADQSKQKWTLNDGPEIEIKYAKGFALERYDNGVQLLHVSSPWPGAEETLTYALVNRNKMELATNLPEKVQAVIPVPVNRLIATSTTHIPALEALGVADRLVGFPETKYISSPQTRQRIEKGQIAELGSNESINTEITLALEPELIIGFGIKNLNKAYHAFESAGVPVVYNGDWTEESPLGKSEWIKFFAPFFNMEENADSIFRSIEESYLASKRLAQTVNTKPMVLGGALYKDVWYMPGGKSWAANFIADANADYIYADNTDVGSLKLSLESVLAKSDEADYWIGPAQFSSYTEMESANPHYLRFKPFREQKVYTFARTRGATGGLLYYELAPARPDIVLKDLIHIFHPEILPDYEPYFFKPLEN